MAGDPRPDYGPGAPPARGLTVGCLALLGALVICLCYGLAATFAEVIRSAIQISNGGSS